MIENNVFAELLLKREEVNPLSNIDERSRQGYILVSPVVTYMTLEA